MMSVVIGNCKSVDFSQHLESPRCTSEGVDTFLDLFGCKSEFACCSYSGCCVIYIVNAGDFESECPERYVVFENAEAVELMTVVLDVVDPVLLDSDLLSNLQSQVCCLYKFVTDMKAYNRLFSIAYVFNLMDAGYLSF